jgi:hypothetical protein
MKKNIILISILMILLNSCSTNTIEDKIVGMWMIEEMNYSNIDYKDSLNYNMFFFKKDERGLNVKVPEISKYQKEFSPWEIKKEGSSYFLHIISKNKIFNKNLKVSFIKNKEKKMLGVR